MKKIVLIILLALTLASCVNTEEKKITETNSKITWNNIVKNTDTISVSYTGSLENGEVFDASYKHPWEILSFEVWAWKMIPWFDKGVVWMKLWETKTINIPAKDAYWESDELELKEQDFKLLETIGLKKEDLTVWIHNIKQTGWKIEILRIDWDKIYAKHPNPLAGKNLIFEITIDKIVPYVKKEIVNTWDSIAVYYTGSLEDGTIFDATSKHGWVPLEFIVGAGQMIAGFDAGVIGMKLGETKIINIPAAQAYWETWTHELAWKNLVFEVKIKNIK